MRLRWYFQNLQLGACNAFFVPVTKKFDGSWHALVAIAITTLAAQALLEFAAVGTGGTLEYSWYGYHTCLFVLSMATSYAAALVSRQAHRTLDIAVAFLNSYFFIFLPYAALLVCVPSLFNDGNSGAVLADIICVWGCLVMCRIVASISVAGGQRGARIILCGLLAAGMLYVLNAEVYFTRFYYAYDKSEAAAPSALDRLSSEEIFNLQSALLQKQLDGLTVSKEGQTDIYAIGLGSYSQDVFMRDVAYVKERLQKKLGVTNFVSMVNNRTTIETLPLANGTNLQAALTQLASHYLQPAEDIVFLYLTSHGSAENGLSVNLGYKVGLQDLSPARLAKMLKDSGIRNDVIVIAACYSGVFVPALQGENTIVMTAAAADRMSFGCSDANNLTYFTEAYFMNALSKTTDLAKAFDIAKQVVVKRETAGQVDALSNPQISVGSKIRDVLRRYKGAKLVSDEK